MHVEDVRHVAASQVGQGPPFETPRACGYLARPLARISTPSFRAHRPNRCMIHVDHLTRRFGDLTALDDVTFDVGKAEIVGILGLNGAGKTTLMRVLAGYLPATSGTASIAGFDVLRQSIEV